MQGIDNPGCDQARTPAPTSVLFTARLVGQTNPRNTVALDDKIQAQIGQSLKATYDEFLSQPAPDIFRLLLEQLDQGIAEKSGS